jgi:hypothetical protein
MTFINALINVVRDSLKSYYKGNKEVAEITSKVVIEKTAFAKEIKSAWNIALVEE